MENFRGVKKENRFKHAMERAMYWEIMEQVKHKFNKKSQRQIQLHATVWRSYVNELFNQ